MTKTTQPKRKSGAQPGNTNSIGNRGGTGRTRRTLGTHKNELRVEQRAVGELRAYEANPRKLPQAAIDKVARSIKEFGFQQPIVVDPQGVIIAGHTRHQAAQKLGLEQVPVIVADLPEDKARAYRLADNRTAQETSWLDDLLADELGALAALDFDLDAIGFDEHELKRLMDDDELLEAAEQTPDVPDDPVTSLGELWLLGDHRVYCGDATDKEHVGKLLAGLAPGKPHLMVTDPPYGVSYDATWRGKAGHATKGANRQGKVAQDDKADWREAWVNFPGRIAYVWHGGLYAGVVADSLMACEFALRAQIIWKKTVMAMSRGDYHWQHEPCWYAVRNSGNWTGDRKQTTVWEFPSPIHIMSGSKEDKTKHPTQKPIDCMRKPIWNNSAKGDAVYDPFLGSGTTLIAAEMEGRKCYGLEIHPPYVDVIIKRWQDFTGQDATRVDGVTFNRLEELHGQEGTAAEAEARPRYA